MQGNIAISEASSQNTQCLTILNTVKAQGSQNQVQLLPTVMLLYNFFKEMLLCVFKCILKSILHQKTLNE